jgi:hypothetical protein
MAKECLSQKHAANRHPIGRFFAIPTNPFFFAFSCPVCECTCVNPDVPEIRSPSFRGSLHLRPARFSNGTHSMKTAFHNEDTHMLRTASQRPHTRGLTTTLAASLLALACIAGAQPAHAALDATASTNDHNTNVPTGWWMYHGLTAAQVGSYASTNGARLTQVNVDGLVSGSPRFSVRMVRNAGNYSVPGWWWYYGLTFAQVGSYLSTNNARLVDMEPYDAGGGAIRYAVVMVSNTGSAARAWSYLSGVTQPQISTHLSNSGHRMIDLDTYYVGATKYYSMVAVANTGADAKAWQWWINQSTAGVAAKVSAFNGRVVKMDRQKDGT